jgi:hypothetical protein
MTFDTGQPAWPVCSSLHFLVGDISVTIDAHEFRFLNVNLVSNLHVMGLLYLFPCHMFMADKAVVIHSLIGEKVPGKKLAHFRMTIHTSDTFWMDLRG